MSEFQSGTGPTPEEVEQIRARADAASEGPWWPMCMGSEGWNIRNDEIGGTVQERKPLVARVGYGEWEQDKANVAFIVNARSDVPALLAAYDVMKQQRDEAVRSIGRVEALAEKRGGLMGEEIRLALIDSDVSEGS